MKDGKKRAGMSCLLILMFTAMKHERGSIAWASAQHSNLFMSCHFGTHNHGYRLHHSVLPSTAQTRQLALIDKAATEQATMV